PYILSFPTRRSSDLRRHPLRRHQQLLVADPRVWQGAQRRRRAAVHRGVGGPRPAAGTAEAALAALETRRPLLLERGEAFAEVLRSEEHTSELQSPYD